MKNEKYIIVQFVEAFGGGVYTYVKDLCNFLANFQGDTQFEVHLIYSPNRVELDRELFLKEIHPNVFLHEVDMQRSIGLKKDKAVISETRSLIKKIKPNIVHLHSAKAGVIGRFACLGIVSSKSIFYSPHGFSFLQQNLSKNKLFVFKAIEYCVPFLFGGTIVASGDTEYLMSQKIGKSILIRNGVDFTLPNSIFSPIKNKKFTVGTIGRLTPQKNPKLFNDIALKLPDIDFVWIGDGELIDDITAPNIKVTGWVKTREELLQKLNDLDLYSQVSLWEGLPIAILEAMAMKKPLLVSNVTGNRDTVLDGFNGFVFNTLEEAIEKIQLFINEDEKIRMGNYSYQKGNEEYNINVNFLSLVEFYKKSAN